MASFDMDIIKKWTNMKQWIFIFLLHYIVLSLCKEFKYVHCVLHRNVYLFVLP